MTWALIASLAIVFSGSAALPSKVALKTVSGPRTEDLAKNASNYQPSPTYDRYEYDSQAEEELFNLANQDRVRAGLAPLQLDPSLTQAARAHAAEMAEQQQLSHQLRGEPALARRLAAAGDLRLDRAGENVALDSNVEEAERHLLLSPPHRANLLNADYNVAGFAVVRAAGQFYVVQDFGHRLPSYSTDQTGNLVAAAVRQTRAQAGLPPLQKIDDNGLQNTACSMAQQDRLNPRAVHELAQRYNVLTYTNARPEALPNEASQLISNPRLRDFSVGVCYARTATYPNGVYWVALLFY
jgi:uncharacterized protein YkwD